MSLDVERNYKKIYEIFLSSVQNLERLRWKKQTLVSVMNLVGFVQNLGRFRSEGYAVVFGGRISLDFVDFLLFLSTP